MVSFVDQTSKMSSLRSREKYIVELRKKKNLLWVATTRETVVFAFVFLPRALFVIRQRCAQPILHSGSGIKPKTNVLQFATNCEECFYSLRLHLSPYKENT